MTINSPAHMEAKSEANMYLGEWNIPNPAPDKEAWEEDFDGFWFENERILGDTIGVDTSRIKMFIRQLLKKQKQEIISEVCSEIAQFNYLDYLETKKLLKIIRKI